MNNVLKLSVLLISTLYLSGCATTGDSASSAPWEVLTWSQKQETLMKQKQFVLQGAIGISRDSEAWSANVRWQQSDLQHYQLNIIGPVGAGSAKIVGTTEQVFMQTSKGTTHFASTPEALIQKEFGWQLPVSYLRYWVRGLPVPGLTAETTFNDDKTLVHLKQNDWNIDFDNHQRINGLSLPTKINITHNNIRIRIAVSQWQLN